MAHFSEECCFTILSSSQHGTGGPQREREYEMSAYRTNAKINTIPILPFQNVTSRADLLQTWELGIR